MSSDALVSGARVAVAPSGIVRSSWPSVRAQLDRFGVSFDPWQEDAARLILGRRESGEFACSIGGAVMSIPRQTGKTFSIGSLTFALALVRPGSTALWTAHHVATSTETFSSMQGLAQLPGIAPFVSRVLIDSMTVEFVNGSRVMFGARERGFGRGFADVGVLVFDEAQILTERSINDMVPATNTADDPLLLLIGTPPAPTDPSEVFTSRRSQALAGDAEDMVYVEFAAEAGADPEDPRAWAAANPSYPKRTNRAAMLRMLKNLETDAFRREALGIWDEAADVAEVPAAFDPGRWAATVGEGPVDGRVGFGVKFSIDGATVALAGAVAPEAGPVHVEGIRHEPVTAGLTWLVEWLAERQAPVVVDGKSNAGALVSALLQAGIPARRVIRPSADDVIAACAGLADAILGGQVSHPDDPALAVADVVRRPIGKQGGWGLAGRDGGDVTLMEAVTLAHWGVASGRRGGRVVGGRRVSAGRRRAVVM